MNARKYMQGRKRKEANGRIARKQMQGTEMEERKWKVGKQRRENRCKEAFFMYACI